MENKGRIISFGLGYFLGRVGHKWFVHALYWAIILGLWLK